MKKLWKRESFGILVKKEIAEAIFTLTAGSGPVALVRFMNNESFETGLSLRQTTCVCFGRKSEAGRKSALNEIIFLFWGMGSKNTALFRAALQKNLRILMKFVFFKHFPYIFLYTLYRAFFRIFQNSLFLSEYVVFRIFICGKHYSDVKETQLLMFFINFLTLTFERWFRILLTLWPKKSILSAILRPILTSDL